MPSSSSTQAVSPDALAGRFALSVVICTYNNAVLLSEALRCVAAQQADLSSIEVLVIDNNCTDETAQVCESFRSSIAHLRRIVEPRQGQMHARVRGVRESLAPLVAFVDDDNFLDSDWVTTALSFIAARPRCGAFGGLVAIEWEQPPPECVARRSYAFASTDLSPQPRCLRGDERGRLRGAGLVCRKEALERCGWLDWQVCIGRSGRGTMSGDDTEIVLRIARAGYELWFEPGCRLRHRITTRRLTWGYLRSLHFSFAQADPLLLGLRQRGSEALWAIQLLLLFLRRCYWLVRHSLRGLFSADARETAVLTFDTLRGLVGGISATAGMDPQLRGKWLGRDSSLSGDGIHRVMHLHNGRLYGGIERMLHCLAAERSHAPEMEPVFGLCYRGKLAADIQATGARIEILGPTRQSRPWQWARAVWRLNLLLAREHFDAVVCHGSWSLAMFGFCARLRKIPLVLWMHNDTKTRHKNFVEILAGLTRPNLVIANSAFTAASLPLLFSEAPPHFIVPCPVSLPVARSSVTVERSRIRAELSTPMEAVVIVLVGRPERWKGHAELLGALAFLREQPGWVCWITGGAFTPEQTEFLAKLATLANALGIADRIRFVGQREDVADLLAAADIFCQPNVTPEPFGIVFIEALYAGLPVVTTDHGGGREIINPSCGRLVSPSDPAALAEALRELVGNAGLRRRLSDHAPIRGAQISDPARVLPAIKTTLAGVSSRCDGVVPTTAPPAPGLNPMAHG